MLPYPTLTGYRATQVCVIRQPFDGSGDCPVVVARDEQTIALVLQVLG